MAPMTTLVISDLSRQRRFRTDLSGDLTPEHTVDQAIDHYLATKSIPKNGLRFVAVSRGRRLDKKTRLGDLPDADTDWRVLPEATAGAA